jgi:hypothetical protein
MKRTTFSLVAMGFLLAASQVFASGEPASVDCYSGSGADRIDVSFDLNGARNTTIGTATIFKGPENNEQKIDTITGVTGHRNNGVLTINGNVSFKGKGSSTSAGGASYSGKLHIRSSKLTFDGDAKCEYNPGN